MRRFVQRVLALAGKEVRHVLRDPRTLYLALGMPVVMLLLFGYGVSFDIDRIPTVFVDLDRSEASREMRARLLSSGEFHSIGTVATAADGEEMLVRGEAALVFVFPSRFERDLLRGRQAEIQILVDGSDNNTAVQARAKAEAAAQIIAMRVGIDELSAGAPPVAVRTFTRFNPEGRSAIFLVPGITAYVLAIVAVLLTALTVAREWERGSMAQLFATPVGRLEIVLGKLLPYLALGSLAVLLVLAMGAWVFEVPFRGSPFALVVITLLFLVGMLGQGLLISVLARNQMVATQVAAMSSMLPSMLLSGFVFPIENMPLPLQFVSAIIPARHLVAGLRGVLLRGNGFAEVWPQVVALALFALVMMTLATLRFRRTIA